MPVFSVDIDLLLIVLACIGVSVAANHFMKPLAAFVTAGLAGGVLALLIYAASLLLSKGWQSFPNGIPDPRGLLLAFSVSFLFAGVVTVGAVIGQRLQRAR